MEEKNSSNNKTFVSGAVILGLAGLMVKVLGGIFRIPLGNIIGDDGMGYYQTAYPIYVLFLTIATAGIPTAISRMVSERYAMGRPRAAYKVFKVSNILLFLTGLVCACILFFGAEAITIAIKEPDAKYSMMALAPALLVVPLMGSYRGFFQGRQNMRPTAVSQFVEQLFRVIFGLGLTILLLDRGLAIAAAGASFGASAGGIFGLIAIFIIYMLSRKKIRSELDAASNEEEESTSSILWAILVIAVPITLGSAVMPIINSIDTAIVKTRLMAIGYDSDVARSLYGQLTGMAAPVINLPQVFTQAVSMSLVPVIAAAFKRNDFDFMHKNINLGLRYAMIVAAPCGFGMLALAEPIMLLLYPMQKEAAQSAASCLAILAMGVIFLSLIHGSNGVLQGIGKQHIPVINLCIGAVVKIAVTYFMVGPLLDVKGAALGTAAAYFTAALLNILKVKKYTHAHIDVAATFVKPALCAMIMAAGARLAYFAVSHVFGNMVSCAAGVLVGVMLYLVLIFATKTISEDELYGLSKGEKIARLLKKVHIIK